MSVLPPTLTPPAVRMRDAAGDDPRVGHLLASGLGPGAMPRLVIVGFPCDEGVRRNGGRIGAAAAPAAIREALYRMTPDASAPEPFVRLLAESRDLGDLAITGYLQSDQERLGTVIAPHLAADAFVIVLGGGHETALGHFLGHVAAERDVHILNWDAHADVREPADGQGHSGSPFREALLHPSGRCKGYTVAGLQRHSNAAAHIEFVRQHGACHWASSVDAGLVERLYEQTGEPLMTSFDLDAVNRAAAPGVSAPASGGLSVQLWLLAAYQAGRCGAVRSMDIVELNPRVDQDGQTAALAALTVWHVLRGVASRGERTESAPAERG